MLHRNWALHTIPAIQYNHGNVCMNVLQWTDCDDAHNDNDDDGGDDADDKDNDGDVDITSVKDGK